MIIYCSIGILALFVRCVSSEKRTCGEASLLVTLGELDVEVGDKSVNVVISLDLQAKG